MMQGRTAWLMALALTSAACGSSDRNSGPDANPRTLSLAELVDAYQDGEIRRDTFRDELRMRPGTVLGPELPVQITETVLLKPREDGPYRITGDVSVTGGAVLVVFEGVEIEFATDTSLRVEGRLYVVGTSDLPVAFGAAQARYKDIVLESGPNQILGAHFDRGQREIAVEHGTGTTTRIEDSVFDGWGDVAVDVPMSSGVTIIRSTFGIATDESEIRGETIRARGSGLIHIEDSDFGFRRGYFDVIDLQDCDQSPDQWSIIIGNRFNGGEDDAIDLDACSAYVVGNHIRNFRPVDLSIKVAGVNGGGITGDQVTSRPILINNVIDGCYHGIGFKDGSQPTIINNTVVNSNIGITLYQSNVDRPQPSAVVVNNVLVGNLAWEGTPIPQDIVLNGKWWPVYNQVDDVQATIDASYNVTASGGGVYPGANNIDADPLLVIVENVPAPGPGSPAIGSGLTDLSSLAADLRDYFANDFFDDPRTLDAVDRGAVNAR